jgi:serine/threonine protein phosphatase PrpC
MQISSFALSDRGSRDHNEDAHADADLMIGRCVIVADGAGGHQGGEIASKLVVDAVLLHLAAAPNWDGGALVRSIDAASAAVRYRQQDIGRLAEMSSTVALLCIDARAYAAFWTHLGDSRVLFFRRGISYQLTRDHSIVQSFADSGLLSAGPAIGRLDRSKLYAAVGAEGETRPPTSKPLSLQDGDAFLLCTDGVWDVIDANQIASLLGFAGTVQEWVESIGSAVRAAAKPNQDNYTAAGVWIGTPEQITVNEN